MGECWHNNHHAYPGSARLGLHDGEWDPGWWVLMGLQRAGLVWNLRLPLDLPRRPELDRITARQHAHSPVLSVHALNGNFNPGRGHRTLNSFPVLEPVIHASRISGPPKQMFVVTGSGNAVCSYAPRRLERRHAAVPQRRDTNTPARFDSEAVKPLKSGQRADDAPRRHRLLRLSSHPATEHRTRRAAPSCNPRHRACAHPARAPHRSATRHHSPHCASE